MYSIARLLIPTTVAETVSRCIVLLLAHLNYELVGAWCENNLCKFRPSSVITRG